MLQKIIYLISEHGLLLSIKLEVTWAHQNKANQFYERKIEHACGEAWE
jgi:hypothetical protein